MCVCILYKHRDPKLLPEFFDRCCKGMVEVSYPCPPWAFLASPVTPGGSPWGFGPVSPGNQSSWNAEESNTWEHKH